MCHSDYVVPSTLYNTVTVERGGDEKEKLALAHHVFDITASGAICYPALPANGGGMRSNFTGSIAQRITISRPHIMA